MRILDNGQDSVNLAGQKAVSRESGVGSQESGVGSRESGERGERGEKGGVGNWE